MEATARHPRLLARIPETVSGIGGLPVALMYWFITIATTGYNQPLQVGTRT